jgi:hypothetical protein
MKKAIIVAILLPFLFISLQSCKKEAGSGGSSSIYGKVKVKDYNDTFTTLLEEYYAQDVDVFIVYGDDKSYSDHNRTGYDGTYEFKYLRPGDYKIYVYSKDSSLQTNAMIPIIKEVTISKNKEEVEVPEISIFD